MELKNKLSFQFISEPMDVNFGGNVHGGAVMKWIDQAAYACAASWAGGYCVTVYVGGIRFYNPIKIGELVRIDAQVLYTGETSIHMGVDVWSRHPIDEEFRKTTHCVMVFVSVDENGKGKKVNKWAPSTEDEIKMEAYAKKLMELRKEIEKEMLPFVH